jgi:hypothetical protein
MMTASEVSPIGVGFAIGAAYGSEVIHDDVGGRVVVTRDDRWRPAGITHRNSPRNRTGNSITTWHNPFLPTQANLQWPTGLELVWSHRLVLSGCTGAHSLGPARSATQPSPAKPAVLLVARHLHSFCGARTTARRCDPGNAGSDRLSRFLPRLTRRFAASGFFYAAFPSVYVAPGKFDRARVSRQQLC